VFDLTWAGQMIGLISVGMTLLASLVRHAVLDKATLKEQKEKMKYHQEQIKHAQKNNDIKGMQTHQQRLMEVTMEQMRQGMKPMLFTLIPFIIVFNWMSGAYGGLGEIRNATVTAVIPSHVDVESVVFNTNGSYVDYSHSLVWRIAKIEALASGEFNATLKVKGDVGPYSDISKLSAEYTLSNGSVVSSVAAADGLVGPYLNLEAAPPVIGGGSVSYVVRYSNLDSYRVATVFGYDLGWFGWYFICSFVSSIAFNKLFGNT